jgi:hypothetical protein
VANVLEPGDACEQTNREQEVNEEPDFPERVFSSYAADDVHSVSPPSPTGGQVALAGVRFLLSRA